MMLVADFQHEVTVIDPDSKGEVALSVFKHRDSGSMFAIDSSFLVEVIPDDEDPVIPDPFNDGCNLYLEGL